MANFTLRIVGDRLRDPGPRLCELAGAADRPLRRAHFHLARSAVSRSASDAPADWCAHHAATAAGRAPANGPSGGASSGARDGPGNPAAEHRSTIGQFAGAARLPRLRAACRSAARDYRSTHVTTRRTVAATACGRVDDTDRAATSRSCTSSDGRRPMGIPGSDDRAGRIPARAYHARHAAQ